MVLQFELVLLLLISVPDNAQCFCFFTDTHFLFITFNDQLCVVLLKTLCRDVVCSDDLGLLQSWAGCPR